MEIDPETGMRSDGAWVANAKLSQLAHKSVKLREQIQALETDRADAIKKRNLDGAKLIGEAIRAGYRKLSPPLSILFFLDR